MSAFPPHGRTSGPLTPAQARYLAEIRARPGRSYNGRGGITIRNLEARGLITYDYELVPHVIGSYTERYTCHPTPPTSQEKPA